MLFFIHTIIDIRISHENGYQDTHPVQETVHTHGLNELTTTSKTNNKLIDRLIVIDSTLLSCV